MMSFSCHEQSRYSKLFKVGAQDTLKLIWLLKPCKTLRFSAVACEEKIKSQNKNEDGITNLTHELERVI